MSIDNQIFEHYREQQRKIQEAKTLLEEHGYHVEESKDKDIQQEIKRLQSKLTGQFAKDIETAKEIARLNRIIESDKN